MKNEKYDHKQIEKAAQEKWESLQLYTVDLTDTDKEPTYLLTEFPYPSGDLHIGHWYAFSIPDIYARIERMRGKNVLFPFGFDSFGLPAENAAIKNGVDPKEWTYANIDRMRAQVRSMGGSFDWSKEVITSDPSYYKWTQWLFTKFFEHNLAYKKTALVNWDPVDKTVLANEQVLPDGTAERSGAIVEKKELEQWFLRITQYAERLIDDLEGLNWPEEIKAAQRAWIGRSEGARLTFQVIDSINGTTPFPVEEGSTAIDVFTTRPDTIFGTTYVVLAPEHPLVDTLLPKIANAEEVEAYRKATSKKSERERSENKQKTGVQLSGLCAINPATRKEIPIFIADYVLAGYGTGAVMAVPAHDERDFEFAKVMGLPMLTVVEPIFIKKEGSDAVRPDEPLVERTAAVAVIKHWEDDSYLVLKWKLNDWCGFVVGGVEEGEDTVSATLREIHEETGYKNAQYIRPAQERIHSQFYHEIKKQNRFGHFNAHYFELKDGERDEMAQEEQALHEVVWVPKEEVAKMLSGDVDMAFIWNRMNSLGAYTGKGLLTNSGEFDGRDAFEAIPEIVQSIGGEMQTNYRLRDWLISRQRYWGCPMPVVYDPEGTPHAVGPEHLPWLLPTDVDFGQLKRDDGQSPLATSTELKERVTRIFGEGWTPEYDTLDVFADSSWYYLRYLDAHDPNSFSDPELMASFMPVKRYSGGAEHTTVHVLYARFFYKALFDLALVPTSEPFLERFNRGLILGTDGQKMSKRWGNVINPDEMVEKYGADSVRLYLAFIGPYNEPGNYPWNLDGVEAMRRFLDRVAKVAGKVTDGDVSDALSRSIAKAADKVSRDADRYKFNTALSALMVLLKDFEQLEEVPRAAYIDLLTLLAPFAPHLSEHLFEQVGGADALSGSIHQRAWITPPAHLLEVEVATVIVQIGGKKRAELTISPDASEAEALERALELPEIKRALEGAEPSRVIYVAGRILNLVP